MELKVGMRVKAIAGKGYGSFNYHGFGTIRALKAYILVEFDEEFSGGHTGGGLAKTGHGWNFQRENISDYLEIIEGEISMEDYLKEKHGF